MSRKKERKYSSARERAEKRGSGTGPNYINIPEGLSLFKPKAGTMFLDILPYEAGDGNPNADSGITHWERTFYIHRGVGANSDWVICPRKTANKKCPVCEHRMALQKKADEDDEQLIKDLAPKERQLFIVKNLKEPEKGFQLWEVSYHLFGKLLDARILHADEDDDWDQFFFLEGGFTLRVGFAESSLAGYTFLEAETIDFKSRKHDYEEDVLEDVPCLDEILVVPAYKQLKAAFLEITDDEEEEEEEEKPSRSSRKTSAKSSKASKRSSDDDDEEEEDEPRPRKKKKLVDEDDADEEVDIFLEDEEESPKKKKKKPPVDDDEDWDEFDEDDADEEEEEESPKKKKKKPVDDEEEEEEEEEPSPRKKRAVKPSPKKRAVKRSSAKQRKKDDDDWDAD